MAEKTEAIFIRVSPTVKEILSKAAHLDHRPLGNFLVHAGLLYAKELLGENCEEDRTSRTSGM